MMRIVVVYVNLLMKHVVMKVVTTYILENGEVDMMMNVVISNFHVQENVVRLQKECLWITIYRKYVP